MSVRSLFSSNSLTGQLLKFIEPKNNRAQLIKKIVRDTIPSLHKRNSSSISSLCSLESTSSLKSWTSISSLCSLESTSSFSKNKNYFYDSNEKKMTSAFSKPSLTLSSELLAKVEDHEETGNKYLLLEHSLNSSKFLFFQKGDLSKVTCYSVFRSNGDSIFSEEVLRDMVRCFCFIKEDIDLSWEKKSIELFRSLSTNRKYIRYNIIRVHFESKDVIVHTRSLNLSLFSGTRLHLSNKTKEKVEEILTNRFKKYNN